MMSLTSDRNKVARESDRTEKACIQGLHKIDSRSTEYIMPCWWA